MKYVWVSIDLNNQLSCIRNQQKIIEKELKLENLCSVLPLHLSLKISFPVDEKNLDQVCSDIVDYYQHLKPFKLQPIGIAIKQNICWIKYNDNLQLKEIHQDLDNMLLTKYSIQLHPFDKKYQFHTTLFKEDNSIKLKSAYEYIKNVSLPKNLEANKFIIGVSPDGFMETYKITKTINISSEICREIKPKKIKIAKSKCEIKKKTFYSTTTTTLFGKSYFGKTFFIEKALHTE